MTGLAVGLCMSLAMAALVLPDGWWARARLRRARRQCRPDRAPAPRGQGRPRVATRALTPLLDLAQTVGRVLRSLMGRPSDRAADRRLGIAVLAASATAVAIGPLVAVPVAAAAWAGPALRNRARRRHDERQVRTVLPDVVDLFRLAVGSGLSLHQAIDAVAARAPAPVDDLLREVQRRVRLGVRLGDALDALEPLGDAAHPLASALRGAARYGAPLGPSLERVAADARVLRRRRAEEEARRLPVQLLFPLVMCVLPAFGLLAVVPLLLASLRSLQL